MPYTSDGIWRQPNENDADQRSRMEVDMAMNGPLMTQYGDRIEGNENGNSFVNGERPADVVGGHALKVGMAGQGAYANIQDGSPGPGGIGKLVIRNGEVLHMFTPQEWEQQHNLAQSNANNDWTSRALSVAIPGIAMAGLGSGLGAALGAATGLGSTASNAIARGGLSAMTGGNPLIGAGLSLAGSAVPNPFSSGGTSGNAMVADAGGTYDVRPQELLPGEAGYIPQGGLAANGYPMPAPTPIANNVPTSFEDGALGGGALAAGAGALGLGALATKGASANTFDPSGTNSTGPSGDSGAALPGNPGSTGIGGISGVSGSGTALSRIMDGTGSTADWASVLGTAGATGLSLYNSNQQASALKDISNQYLSLGAPYRDRLASSYADPAAFLKNSPDINASVQQGSDALARSLSRQGNPAGNGAALHQIQDYATNGLYGQLGNARNSLANFGGLSSFNQAAPSTQIGAVNAQGAGLTNLAGGISNIINPPQQNSIAALLKQYGVNTL